MIPVFTGTDDANEPKDHSLGIKTVFCCHFQQISIFNNSF